RLYSRASPFLNPSSPSSQNPGHSVSSLSPTINIIHGVLRLESLLKQTLVPIMSSIFPRQRLAKSVTLHVNADGQKLVVGTLSHQNFPQLSFDLVFDQEFELSHNWKNGSVVEIGLALKTTSVHAINLKIICDHFKVVEHGRETPELRANPTINQIRQHSEKVAKKYKALSHIHAAVTKPIFARIMACETAKEAWDKLKEEFQGSNRTKKMQVLNLMRQFEVLKMKENEFVKDYVDKLVKIVNQVRLLGVELSDSRIMEKVLVSIPERFESKIATLEESKDLTLMTMQELVNALQAAETRRQIMLDEHTEIALQAKFKDKNVLHDVNKKFQDETRNKQKAATSNQRQQSKKTRNAVCYYCKKTNHAEKYCWFRPNVKCRKCNQLGHVEKVCKNKFAQQNQQAKVSKEAKTTKELLFMTSEGQTGNTDQT
ncbi:hypothetical protein QQP08_000438, partial [Theobroma cacao]